MKLKSFLQPALFAASVFATSLGISAAEKAPARSKAADNYPLTTCVVSDEKLGSMGEYVSYTHKEPGKPDRVVRFCCEGCIDDFKADPAKFLAKLDAAEKAKATEKKAGSAKK